MRSFFRPALNCFIRDEPGIPSAPEITAACVAPACNVALVLIRNSESESIDFHVTGLGKMENVFVTIV